MVLLFIYIVSYVVLSRVTSTTYELEKAQGYYGGELLPGRYTVFLFLWPAYVEPGKEESEGERFARVATRFGEAVLFYGYYPLEWIDAKVFHHVHDAWCGGGRGDRYYITIE